MGLPRLRCPGERGHRAQRPRDLRRRGRAAFRAEETRALTTALSGADPMVVSVAGGAVLSAANRALLARSGTVVWLRADPRLTQRVGDGAGRPLLGDDPGGALAALYEVRRPLYDAVADGDGGRRRSLARGGGRPGASGAGWARVRRLSPASGQVDGHDHHPGGVGGAKLRRGRRRRRRERLADVIASAVPGAGRVAVVTQADIGIDVDPGLPWEVFTVPDGEGAKSLVDGRGPVPRVRPVRPDPSRCGRGRGRWGGDRRGRLRGSQLSPRHGAT